MSTLAHAWATLLGQLVEAQQVDTCLSNFAAFFQRLFYFYIFQKHFFTEIYFRFHNLQFYTPAARQEAAGTYM